LEIVYYKSLPSTQTKIQDLLTTKAPPFLIWTNHQSDGLGSRDNKWVGIKGSLFFSLVITKQSLPKDLPLNSISIYIAWQIKEILSKMKSKAFLKWPNDLYIEDKKIGGLLSQIKKENIIIGCGINKIKTNEFDSLDININDELFLKELIKGIKKYKKWSEILNQYQKEFHKSDTFYTNHKNQKLSLKNASLQSDGSIVINGMRIFSCR